MKSNNESQEISKDIVLMQLRNSLALVMGNMSQPNSGILLYAINNAIMYIEGGENND